MQTVPVELDAIVRDEVSAASLVPLCLLLDEVQKPLKAVVRARDIFHSLSVLAQNCWDGGFYLFRNCYRNFSHSVTYYLYLHSAW